MAGQCQGLNINTKIWIDYNSANQNLLTKKKRIKCEQMPEHILKSGSNGCVWAIVNNRA